MKSKYILSLLLALIGILVLNMGSSWILLHNSAGNGKQINDIGRIRGGIQRIVKLQYAGMSPGNLVLKMDDQIEQLIQICSGDGAYNPRYRTAVMLASHWDDLKLLLTRYGEEPSPQNGSALLQASEEIWEIADDAAKDSQLIDEKNLYNMKYSLALVGVDIVLAFVALYLIKSYVRNELEFHANHDPLTKLYNRKYFMAVFSQFLKQAARYKQALSVVLIDIDRFKQVNDTFGHVAGDKVLVELGSLLTANTRKSDVVCRFGGEEFIVLLPNTDEPSAFAAADKFRHAVEAHDFKGVGSVTISLGAYSYQAQDDEDAMIRKADIALYQAKETGRNQVVTFRESGREDLPEMK